MKNIQMNLLVVLSMGLCGLCAWQWYVQTQLHNEGQVLQQKIFKRDSDIQGYTNSIKNMDSEIAGLSTRINELKQENTTNQYTAAQQKIEIFRLQFYSDAMSNQVVQYQSNIVLLETRLKEASAGIVKQNEAISNLVSERDDVIKKCNDSIKSQRELAAKYNDLVDRYNKLQAAGAAEAPKQ
jgi:uncharacterized coiled-coil DUF342 family protein